MLEVVLSSLSLATPITLSGATEPSLPPAVERMISAGMKFEDEDQRIAVIDAARKAYPDHQAEIDQIIQELEQPVIALEVAPLVVTGVKPEPGRFDFLKDMNGSLALNTSYTQGNTTATVFGFRLDTNMIENGHIHRLEAFADEGRANGITNQRKWGVSYQLETLWTKDIFGYVRASHEDDDFSGFDYRSFVGAGAGKYLLKEEAFTLRGEVGPGYRISEVLEEDETDYDWVLYGSLDSGWVIADDLKASNTARLTLSEPTTTLKTSSRISTSITEAMRAGVSYEVRFETDPPETSKNLDSIFKFDVSYGF